MIAVLQKEAVSEIQRHDQKRMGALEATVRHVAFAGIVTISRSKAGHVSNNGHGHQMNNHGHGQEVRKGQQQE